METKVEGVFAVGDVTEKFLKQVATAVGDGAVAGFAAEKYIAELEVYDNQILGKDGVVFVYDASEQSCREYLCDIDNIEKQAAGRFQVTRVDVYKSRGISNRMNIHRIPSLAVIKDRKIIKVFEEVFTCEAVLKALELDDCSCSF